MSPTDWKQVVQEPDRLDRWLHQRLGPYSMARVRELIRDGRVRVDGRGAKKGARLQPGSTVEVLGLPAGPVPLADEGLSLEVAYDDPEIVVVEKPAGVPTHPLSPEETGTLVNAAVARWPAIRGVGARVLEPGLLHRLDIGTSGLVMMARDQESFEFMRHEFQMHRVGKHYRAVVRGEVKKKSGVIDVPLGRHPRDPGLILAALPGARVRGEPRPALTRYRVVETGADRTLLDLELVTGVMHQIRAHLSHIGHPVVGDDRYGGGAGGAGYALQAWRLEFTHPRTRDRVMVRVKRVLEIGDAPAD